MQELQAALSALERGERAALILVTAAGGSTPRHAGARMVLLADGTTVGTIGGGEVEHQVLQLAGDALEAGRPATFEAHLTRDLGMCCGGKMSVHIEPLLPPPELLVFGAGHVAHALAPIATALEFRVTVVDDRDELNHAERFACRREVVDPLRYAERLVPDANRYILIVTHDHGLDLELCRTLLPREAAWIGMIGSRGKVARFALRLRAAGLQEEHLQRLRAPVGLDLGGRRPAEIAVSIAAELIQHRSAVDATGRPLASVPPPRG